MPAKLSRTRKKMRARFKGVMNTEYKALTGYSVLLAIPTIPMFYTVFLKNSGIVWQLYWTITVSIWFYVSIRFTNQMIGPLDGKTYQLKYLFSIPFVLIFCAFLGSIFVIFPSILLILTLFCIISIF